MLVFMLGVTGRAACLFHVLFDHRHDGVVRHPPFTRAVVIENVTKPKLALLHSISPEGADGGERAVEAVQY
jgi:hypothetical protein